LRSKQNLGSKPKIKIKMRGAFQMKGKKVDLYQNKPVNMTLSLCPLDVNLSLGQ
jgi:hypothetical protein